MVLLVRYGELALKSTYVRRLLEDRLAANVQDQFAANRVQCIVKVTHGRLFVHADDEVAALRLLRRVFGVVSVSPTTETSSDLETITTTVVAYARPLLKAGTTFAIRPRRSGQHPYTSQDLARVLGRAVQDAIPGLVVDLDAPDLVLYVEVRGARAFVFHEVMSGPGGLPLGSQGVAEASVDDEDGMVAAWLLMRRGCRVRTGEGPFADILRRWDPRLETVARSESGAVIEARTPHAVFAWPPGSHTEAPLVLHPLAGLTTEERRALASRIRDA